MLENIKSFFKRFWGYLAAGLGLALGLSFYKKKVDVYEDIVQKMQQSHEKELEAIKKAREEERAKYEENERKYKERMAAIEKEYEAAKVEFDAKKKSAAEKIVRTYGDKPDKLAEKLAEVTGFKIVLPEV